jgi:D-glycerate 3-kinase
MTGPNDDDWLTALLERERLPASYAAFVNDTLAPLAAQLAHEAVSQPLLMGLCGAQGSGKSTAAAALAQLLQHSGVATAVLSIDDFYLTRAEREQLAREVHPLLRTRGVPGTHDVPLMRATLNALQAGELPPLPRFDKACDDRVAESQWLRPNQPPRIVLLEGWCVGARPESSQALATPINALERDEDTDGRWRQYVNDALTGPYRPVFDALHPLVLLAAPSFDVVYRWRLEQEHKLRERRQREGGDASGVMSDVQVARFIAHYERVTRHILAEMPARADVLIRLDTQRRAMAASTQAN